MALNLAAISTITAKTAYLVTPTTAAVIIAAPSASPATVVKINSLYAANTGAGTYTVDVYIIRTVSSIATTIYIAKSLSIATATTTVVITKDSPIYLEETTDVLWVVCAGSTPTVTFTVSYEILA